MKNTHSLLLYISVQIQIKCVLVLPLTEWAEYSLCTWHFAFGGDGIKSIIASTMTYMGGAYEKTTYSDSIRIGCTYCGFGLHGVEEASVLTTQTTRPPKRWIERWIIEQMQRENFEVSCTLLEFIFEKYVSVLKYQIQTILFFKIKNKIHDL